MSPETSQNLPPEDLQQQTIRVLRQLRLEDAQRNKLTQDELAFYKVRIKGFYSDAVSDLYQGLDFALDSWPERLKKVIQCNKIHIILPGEIDNPDAHPFQADVLKQAYKEKKTILDYSREISPIAVPTTSDVVALLIIDGQDPATKDQEILNDISDLLGILIDSAAKITVGNYIAGIEPLKYYSRNLEMMKKSRKKMVSVLMADVKGYTSLSTESDPEALTEILNYYYEIAEDVFISNKVDIMQYKGDSVMGAWGAFEAPASCTQAVEAAVQLQLQVKEVNLLRASKGLRVINFRIGGAYDLASICAIGGRRRKEITALGNPTNTAQRVEAITPPGEVCVTEAFYQKVNEESGKIEGEEFLPGVELKGLPPVKLYRITHAGGASLG